MNRRIVMARELFEIITTEIYETTEETVEDILREVVPIKGNTKMRNALCFGFEDEYPIKSEQGWEGYIEVAGVDIFFVRTDVPRPIASPLHKEDKVFVTRRISSQKQRKSRERAARGSGVKERKGGLL
jgi:hypothetical protein